MQPLEAWTVHVVIRLKLDERSKRLEDMEVKFKREACKT